MQVKLDNGTSEPLECNVLQEVQIGGKPFVVVDLGAGQFVRGVYSRYFVVSTSAITNKTIEDIRSND
jgi:hypothetical protein